MFRGTSVVNFQAPLMRKGPARRFLHFCGRLSNTFDAQGNGLVFFVSFRGRPFEHFWCAKYRFGAFCEPPGLLRGPERSMLTSSTGLCSTRLPHTFVQHGSRANAPSLLFVFNLLRPYPSPTGPITPPPPCAIHRTQYQGCGGLPPTSTGGKGEAFTYVK